MPPARLIMPRAAVQWPHCSLSGNARFRQVRHFRPMGLEWGRSSVRVWDAATLEQMMGIVGHMSWINIVMRHIPLQDTLPG